MALSVRLSALQVGALRKATLFTLGGEAIELKAKASASDDRLEVELPARQAAPAAVIFRP